MAEEKKAPAKKEQPGKVAKILNWFKTLPQRIVKPFKNMYYELKKVSWPSKQKLISYSIIVLVFMLFMSVVIGLLDLGASTGVRALITSSAASTSTTNTEPETTDAPTTTDAAPETTEGPTATDAAPETTEGPAATDAAPETTDAPAATDTTPETTGDAAAAVENAAEGTQESAGDSAEGK